MRRFSSNLALMIISIVITVVLLEVGARLIPLWPDHLSDFDPQLGFAHIPGARGWWMNIEAPFDFRAWVTINSHGLHDREFELEKPEGVTRFLFLGDSMVDGLEVPLEANFTKQAETLFRQDRERVEVINGGHYGYGTDQALLFYTYRGYKFQPDVVVLSFFARNDLNDNQLFMHMLGPKPYFELGPDGSLTLRNFPVPAPLKDESVTTDPIELLKQFLYAHSKLYKFIGFQIKRNLPFMRPVLTELGLMDAVETPNLISPAQPGVYTVDTSTQVYNIPISDDFERGWQVTEAIIRKFKTEVEAAGVNFIVMVMVDPQQLDPPPPGSRWNVTVWNDRMAQLCNQENMTCLDLYPVFQHHNENRGDTSLFYRDGHFTVTGHTLVAQTLYDYFQHHKLLLTPSSGQSTPN